jgi:drug/metabolite transporter (DMT)-like permease
LTESPSDGDGAAADGADMPVSLAYTMLVLTALFWGGTTVAARAAAGDIPPLTLTFWRWTIAFVLFVPIGLGPWWRQRALYRAHWKLMTLLSFLGIVGFTMFYFMGLEYTTAINGSLLHGGLPVMIVLASLVILRTRVARVQWLGIAVALAGTAVIVLRGDLDRLRELSVNPGDLLLLLAMLSWTLYTICLRWLPDGVDPVGLIFALAGLSLPMLLPFYLLDLANGRSFALSAGNISLILYTAVFSSVIAYLFWNKGVARVGANTAGFSHYLIPVFGTILSVLLLDETLESFHIVAIALIFAGLYLCTARGSHS